MSNDNGSQLRHLLTDTRNILEARKALGTTFTLEELEMLPRTIKVLGELLSLTGNCEELDILITTLKTSYNDLCPGA